VNARGSRYCLAAAVSRLRCSIENETQLALILAFVNDAFAARRTMPRDCEITSLNTVDLPQSVRFAVLISGGTFGYFGTNIREISDNAI